MTDVILITGASSALGLALLKRLAAANAVVYAHCSGGIASLEAHLSTLSGPARFIPVRADFSSLAETHSMIDVIREQHGKPNKIVHTSAPPLILDRFAKVRWEDMDRDWNISVRSIVHIARVFLPDLARERRAGSIVFALSSTTIGVPPKGMAAYTTVKYALLGLMRSLACEYAESRIRVNAVSPYTMETPFLAKVPHKFAELAASNNPARRNATPADVVPAIEFLLSEVNSFITGTNVPVAGGATF